MKFLSNILKRAAQSSSSSTELMPYIHFQRYFQLFVEGIYTLKDNPPLDSLAVKIPGQIFQNFNLPEGADFLSAETSFTTTGEFTNGNGGHIYHGEYITHGKDGGAMEYLYMVIASSEETADPSKKKFTPHFVYLGGLVAGKTQQGVYPVFILTQSRHDGENAIFHVTDHNSLSPIISAMAYADIPFKQILAGKKVDANVIAAAFSATSIEMHLDKFYDTIDARTPHSLALGMNP